MAKKKQSNRTLARKLKDKWKAKEWYKVNAPAMFNNIQIAETLSDDPAKLMGRVAEVTVQDITGDFSKMHIKLRFKVGDVTGYTAHTYFIGHTLTSDYIRRMTRRKHSKTDGTFDVRTKDNYLVRLKPMAVTERRIQGSQQQAIRKRMSEVIARETEKRTLGDLVKVIISGELPKLVSRECKTIYPLKRVEIRKTEILHMPADMKDQMKMAEPEEPEEVAEEALEGVEKEDGAPEPEDEAEAEEMAEDEAEPGEDSEEAEPEEEETGAEAEQDADEKEEE